VRVIGAGGNIRSDQYENTAWQLALGWVLTGEDATYSGVKPAHNFDPETGDFGAFEAVGRIGQFNVDGDAFTAVPGSLGATIASAATPGSARDNQAWGLGLNWYLNSNVRLSINYYQSSFFGGDGTNPVVKSGEEALLSRFQVNF
jgi:phosphate-selective porin OprO/OprP